MWGSAQPSMNSNHRANPTRTAPRIGPHRTIAPTSIEAGVLAMRAEYRAENRAENSAKREC